MVKLGRFRSEADVSLSVRPATSVAPDPSPTSALGKAPNTIRLYGSAAEVSIAVTLRRNLIDPQIAAHSGRIVKLMGDGVLVEFGSAVDAVACAIKIQKHLGGHDADGGSP